jgi:hypothetical protein
MARSKNLLLATVLLMLTGGAIVSTPRKASAIAPLSYSWSCAPGAGVCTFNVTSNYHAMYQWNFGDGSTFGPTTTKTKSHDYDFVGVEHSYTVTLIGYGSNPPSSPDNIISCTVDAQGPSVGGNPGTAGTCS